MKALVIMLLLFLAATQVYSSDSNWYTGGGRCLPPKDDGTYSAPYNALDHPRDFPTFSESDKPGWSCSYQREDGVIVQFGDSRTPQQQWLDLYSGNSDNMD